MSRPPHRRMVPIVVFLAALAASVEWLSDARVHAQTRERPAAGRAASGSSSSARGQAVGQPRDPIAAQPALVPTALDRLSERVRQQIRALASEKAGRTPAQRKISSRLLYGAKSRRGLRLAGDITSLRSSVRPDANGRVDVEIRTASASFKRVAAAVARSGGTVAYGSEASPVIRAIVPIEQLEPLASLAEIKAIRPTMPFITHARLNDRRAAATRGAAWARAAVAPAPVAPVPVEPTGVASGRAARLREQLRDALARVRPQQASTPPPLSTAGAATSAGDVAHRVQEARQYFGVTGAGVKIGVLSDSVDFLGQSQASGDLPFDVAVLPGQSGSPGSGEGTAMLEIIHDLAPGAKLFFATAKGGVDQFAANIRALRAAGCDIIVDDVLYANESPFQDGVAARAVEEVTTDGAFYFASAGNDGNLNDGASSVWEGDYTFAANTIGALEGAGDLHDFGGGAIANPVESNSNFLTVLFWSDPFGQSGNDYDLYVLDSTLSTIIDASTNVQDGDDDPIEGTLPGGLAGDRLVIVKYRGEGRALHVNNFGGSLTIATDGSTHGHNSAERAFGVGAVDVIAAQGGAFTGGEANPVNYYSSDGYRRVFFNADGVAFTPGNVLFATDGGIVRRKPDLTAADGVQTTVPGFRPFWGTSASAPHAAAIAGLLKAAQPDIKMYRLRQALTQTALDVEAPGRDRDSGFGIVDAFSALAFIGAAPSPFLELGPITTNVTSGDGDTIVEPGETVSLTLPLINLGGATAGGVEGTLASIAPGVTIVSAQSTYPPIDPGGASAFNTTPFVVMLAPTTTCGAAPDFTLTASYAPGASSPQTFTFRVPTGAPGPTTTASYTGAPVAIPDNAPAGVAIPFTVSGLTGAIADLNFRFDGDACTASPGAATVGLEHSWIGDTVIRLQSPRGTIVTLNSRAGGAFNEGNNFCQTVFDDDGAASIQEITPAQAPFTGTFRPASPLAAFNGEDPNGTWTLTVADVVLEDSGHVRAFSMDIKSFECDTAPPVPPTTTARRAPPLIAATP